VFEASSNRSWIDVALAVPAGLLSVDALEESLVLVELIRELVLLLLLLLAGKCPICANLFSVVIQ
jgi:hypothetical protein